MSVDDDDDGALSDGGGGGASVGGGGGGGGGVLSAAGAGASSLDAMVVGRVEWRLLSAALAKIHSGNKQHDMAIITQPIPYGVSHHHPNISTHHSTSHLNPLDSHLSR